MLYPSASENAANPPESWSVERRASRSWAVVDASGTVLQGGFATKASAESARLTGDMARLWDKERRWFAGERVDGWKPYVAPVAVEADDSLPYTDAEIAAMASRGNRAAKRLVSKIGGAS